MNKGKGYRFGIVPPALKPGMTAGPPPVGPKVLLALTVSLLDNNTVQLPVPNDVQSCLAGMNILRKGIEGLQMHMAKMLQEAQKPQPPIEDKPRTLLGPRKYDEEENGNG